MSFSEYTGCNFTLFYINTPGADSSPFHTASVSDQMYIFLTETLPFKIESNGRFYEVTREKSDYMMLNFEQNTSFAIEIVLRTRQQTFTFLHSRTRNNILIYANEPTSHETNKLQTVQFTMSRLINVPVFLLAVKAAVQTRRSVFFCRILLLRTHPRKAFDRVQPS